MEASEAQTGRRVASLIEIERGSDGSSIRIDGVELPWYVDHRLDVRVSNTEIPSVTLTVWADQVKVNNQTFRSPRP